MKEKYDKSVSKYNKALEIQPNNDRALINRALTYNAKEQYQKATEDLDKVISLNPAHSLAYYNRALIKTHIGAYNEAIEDYTQVLKYNPQNILSYFNRGAIRMQIDDYAHAIRDFTMAIKLYPNFAKAYQNRAIARRKVQDYEGAKKDMQTAEKINKAYRKNKLSSINFSDTTENFKRLISLQNSKNLPQQFGNIKKEIEPRENYSIYFNPGTEQNLAEVLSLQVKDSSVYQEKSYFNNQYIIDHNPPDEYSREVHEKRIKELTDSIKLFPNKTHLYILRALSRKTTRNYNQALRDVSKVIKKEPDNFLAWFIRGNIRTEMIEYIKMMEDDSKILQINLDRKFNEEPIERNITFHDYKKAIKDYNRAVKLAPNFIYAYYNRANAKIRNKNFQQALNDYNKVIFLDNKFAEAYFNRGMTKIYLQKNTEGCIDISKAGELGIDEAYTVIKIYCQ
jgi:tetratricopeptide (TPR) repeat protein